MYFVATIGNVEAPSTAISYFHRGIIPLCTGAIPSIPCFVFHCICAQASSLLFTDMILAQDCAFGGELR